MVLRCDVQHLPTVATHLLRFYTHVLTPVFVISGEGGLHRFKHSNRIQQRNLRPATKIHSYWQETKCVSNVLSPVQEAKLVYVLPGPFLHARKLYSIYKVRISCIGSREHTVGVLSEFLRGASASTFSVVLSCACSVSSAELLPASSVDEFGTYIYISIICRPAYPVRSPKTHNIIIIATGKNVENSSTP